MHQPGTWTPHNIPEVAPKLEPRTRAAVLSLRSNSDPTVPSWMRDYAPAIASRRTSISTTPGSSRRRRTVPSSPSSASSMCGGLPTQDIIRSTMRCRLMLQAHTCHILIHTQRSGFYQDTIRMSGQRCPHYLLAARHRPCQRLT